MFGFIYIIIIILLIVLFSKTANLTHRITVLEKLLKATRKPSSDQTRDASVQPSIATRASDSSTIANNSIPEPTSTTAAPSACPQPEPIKKDPPSQWLQKLKELFHSINTIVLLGGIILFVGIIFLLNLVAHSDFIPINIRLIGAAIAAGVLFFIGLRLVKKNYIYALSIQGISLAVWYLLAVSSYYHFHLISAEWGLIFLILISILCFGLSVLHNSKMLVLVGILGGFTSPLVMPLSSPDLISFLCFYLILNIIILCIAWFKAWRELNMVGFLFTFCFASFWHQQYYLPHQFLITEVFLALFFVFYLIIPILYASRQPPSLKGVVDNTLIFAVPLTVFSLQSILVHYNQIMLAYSSVGVGVLYLALSAAIYQLGSKNYKLLAQAHLILGVLFLTIACPLALSGEWSTMAWAFEGAAIVWLGTKQQRLLPQVSGCILQVLASLHFIFISIATNSLLDPVLKTAQMRILSNVSLFSLAALMSSYFLFKNKTQRAVIGKMAFFLFLLGTAWLIIDGYNFSALLIPNAYQMMGRLMISTLIAATTYWLGTYFRWPWLSLLRHTLTVMMALCYLAVTTSLSSTSGMFYAWTIAFVCQYLILYQDDLRHNASENLTHIILFWVLTLVIFNYGYDYLTTSNFSTAWLAGFMGLIFSTILTFFLTLGEKNHCWPYWAYRDIFRQATVLPVILFSMLIIFITSLTSSADPFPLHYIPFINPLDIAIILMLMTLIYSAKVFITNLDVTIRRSYYISLIIIAFIWLNAVILRTLHFSFNLPLNSSAILNSSLAQICLSYFYILLSMATMILARVKRKREIWFIGVTMIAVTVVKLFLIDLANINTVNRIITFIGVGVVLLIIGYFSPLPPKEKS